MELKTPTTLTTTTAPTATTTTTTTTTTTPETETETPPTKHLSKGLSFTNGAFKLLHQNSTPPPPPQAVVVYKECLKNHAATLGGHALDGCGEFMPSPTATPTDPTSLKCAACGCHRNFHRRDPEEQGTHMIEYHPQLPTQIPTHRVRSPNSVSPPPISSSYYPSAPQMLLALSTGGLSVKPENHHNSGTAISPMGGITNGSGRKRFRTKFSQEQKDKMYSFSERLGWKMQKRDEGLVEEFCNEVGVGKGVLKVWMHNNKHTFGKREVNGTSGSGGGGGGGSGGVVTTPTNLHSNTIITTPNNNNNTTTLSSNNNNIINTLSSNNNNSHSHHNHGNSAHVGTNCSSSSS